jgi:hypothetical protein
MAKVNTDKKQILKVVKRTSQGGKAKRGTMNKSMKRSYKSYRGQGR